MTANVYYNKADFLGGVVRLAFHDAGTYSKNASDGGPDGCVNLNDADNGGLEAIIAVVESLYAPHKLRLSRADYWVFLANVAASYVAKAGSGETSTDGILTIGFRYGRSDKSCGAGELGRLPDAAKGWQHVKEVFVDRMGLSVREVVALLGAHSLGRAESANSGFEGAWTTLKSPQAFTTQYYLALETTQWKKVKNPKSNKTQWNFEGEVPDAFSQMMLTSDMALLFGNADDAGCTDISPSQVTGTCVRNNETYPIVKEFFKTKVFFPAFAAAFQKLTELGYGEGLLPPGICAAGVTKAPSDATSAPTPQPEVSEGSSSSVRVVVMTMLLAMMMIENV